MEGPKFYFIEGPSQEWSIVGRAAENTPAVPYDYVGLDTTCIIIEGVEHEYRDDLYQRFSREQIEAALPFAFQKDVLSPCKSYDPREVISKVKQEDYPIAVIIHNNTLLGYVLTAQRGRYINYVEIHPDWRGRGLCTQLLSFLFRQLKQRGIRTVGLDNVAEEIGVRCYQRAAENNGYRLICIIPQDPCQHMVFTLNDTVSLNEIFEIYPDIGIHKPISYEQAIEKLQSNQIKRWSVDDFFQSLLRFDHLGNTIVSLIDHQNNGYIVSAQYNPVSNTIGPPLR